jgi:hypothetical protein
VNAGDTLKIVRPGTTYDSHLWMLISDPEADGAYVLVNFTSWREDKDQACVVDVGDHEYIRHKSCVNYKKCKILSADEVTTLLSLSNVTSDKPLSPSLLARIREGVMDSRMPMEAADILSDQGLIDIDD